MEGAVRHTREQIYRYL